MRSVEAFNGDRKLTARARAPRRSPCCKALVERGVEIESFQVASLPLEDIFVKVVREGIGLDHGQSGPVTEPELAGTAS